MAAQVFRPSTPFRGPIPGILQEGKLIEIKGVCPLGADQFSINLLTSLDPYSESSDRALHLSVRFRERSVVRNSLQMNSWGREERTGIFPFLMGQEFTIKILTESHAYRIAVNDRHCWEFRHRIPKERVSSMLVDGHITIEKIEFIERSFGSFQPSVYPAVGVTPAYDQFQQPGVCGLPPPTPAYPARISPGVCVLPAMPTMPSIPTYPVLGQGIGTGICPPPEQICPQPAYISQGGRGGGSNLAPVYNPNIPYAYPIYGGLRPGMTMHISGRPTSYASRFTFNLQAGTNPSYPPDIALHFDVRFDSRTVVRNTRINNVWEREESHARHFPFSANAHFDVMVRVDPGHFMVAVNGQHFVEFAHRLRPVERFDTLSIENDVVIDSIRFE